MYVAKLRGPGASNIPGPCLFLIKGSMTLHEAISLAVRKGYRGDPTSLIRRLAPVATYERGFDVLLDDLQQRQPQLFVKEPTNEQSS